MAICLTATRRRLLKMAQVRNLFRGCVLRKRTDLHSQRKFSAIFAGERVSWDQRALPCGHSWQNRHAPTFRNVLRVAVKRLNLTSEITRCAFVLSTILLALAAAGCDSAAKTAKPQTGNATTA